MRYKIGDAIFLKDNLIVGGLYGSVRFTEGVARLVGKEILITSAQALPEAHNYVYGTSNGLFISEFMINHCKSAQKANSLDSERLDEDLKDDKETDKSVTLEFHMGEKVSNPTKDEQYRVNIRQKSGRVYQFKMDGAKLKKIMDMLHLRRGGSFVEIDNQLINVHEAEHIEYFEL